MSKADVAAFWEAQPFDLDLPNVNGTCWLGNCDGCFLKSEANLSALAREYPDRHAWWEAQEDKISAQTLSSHGAKFSKRYSRKELRTMIERQGDWLFETEGALCQADDGDCL